MKSTKWALVTGASGGLGAEFAVALASRGYNIVLAARDLPRLNGVAARLRQYHDNEVVTEVIDLSQPASAHDLYQRMRTRGIALDVLVNNAGSGLHGELTDQTTQRTEEMLNLNILTLTTLTQLIGADMSRHRRGYILMVASLTAYMPSPSYAAYAASKAFVKSLGEALHFELAPHNVTVTVVSPGVMDTGFLDASGQSMNDAMKRMALAPNLVAQEGLNALFAKRQTIVTGKMNNAIAFASRFLTRKRQTAIMAQSLKN